MVSVATLVPFSTRPMLSSTQTSGITRDALSPMTSIASYCKVGHAEPGVLPDPSVFIGLPLVADLASALVQVLFTLERRVLQ